MSSETEPFANTFTNGKKDTEEVIDNTETSTEVTEVPKEQEVTVEGKKATEQGDVDIIDGIAYIKQTDKYRLPNMVRVTDDMKYRLDVIAANERRKVTAVVELALDEYFMTETCEPRPYLPFSGKECKTRVNYYAAKSISDAVASRAALECRAEQDIVRRALLNYIEKSPYDPRKEVSEKVEVKDTKPVSGKLPESSAEKKDAQNSFHCVGCGKFISIQPDPSNPRATDDRLRALGFKIVNDGDEKKVYCQKCKGKVSEEVSL